MAKKSDGKVIISTKLDNSGLPGGVKEISNCLGGLKSVVKSIGSAIAAAFSVAAIVSFATESVQAANELSDALTGLKSILDGQGRSFSDAEKFLQEYTADGLVPMANAITAYKNLASRGYDDSQIKSVMQALKDASAFGRQASYSMGEAVESATEGLKNENSVLVDNAGVTKNVAKMWEEYAASIGTTANNLTQEQKILAEVNGILEESKYQTGDAAKVAGTLSGQLSQLSVNFENLKVAVGNALKPIVQSFLPVINAAVATLTKFANTVSSVIGALMGNSSAGSIQEVADGYADAASNAEELTEATKEAGKAAKKYLAGFDELTKIGDSASGSSNDSASSSTGSTVSVTTSADIQDEISPQIQAMVDKINELIEPLRQIDFSPAMEAFGRLGESAGRLGEVLGGALEWLWFNLLVPLASWTIEEGVPAAFDFLAQAIDAVVDVCIDIGNWMSENEPLARALVYTIAALAASWWLVNGAIAFMATPIGAITVAIVGLIAIGYLLVESWDDICQVASTAWKGIVAMWGCCCDWFDQNVLTPLVNGFKGMVNSVVGFINGMIAGVESGINALIDAVNKISFEVPEWIPGIGGSKIGFDLQRVSFPKIPYLAKGAVLPANKPFMAMVGDQKHGTNIEAPLATIQEAVAMVMDQYAASNLAGQEAIVEVLREILEAILGIEIGDDVIGQAVARYNRKMAVVRGGT